MTDQMEGMKTMNANEVLIKMVLSAWETYNARATKLFESFTDEQFLSEVAPGRNRSIYLLGHLTAVSDHMLPLLGLGEKNYPHLDAVFVVSPDKPGTEMPPIDELKACWKIVTGKLMNDMNAMNSEEWFARHNAVSEEDFKKEPFRNKLNIVLNRTNHLSYHLGQLMLISKK